MNQERGGDWIQTFTGRQFWPLDPRLEEIDIEDIAHALAHQCRFTGHCREFYSVAEHSVRVADYVELRMLEEWHTYPQVREAAFCALLHDASEAYLIDLARPVKRCVVGYAEAEDRVMAVIAQRFDLVDRFHWLTKEADDVLLVTEKRDLMGPPPAPWNIGREPLAEHIEPWSSEQAKDQFLRKFRALSTGR